MYICSRIDSAIHNTVCKHTHLVQLYMTGTCYTTQPDSQHDTHSSQPDNIDYFTQVLRNEKVSLCSNKWNHLHVKWSYCSKKYISWWHWQLWHTESWARACEECGVNHESIEKTSHWGHTKKKRVALNTYNHELQPHFTSTKKKEDHPDTAQLG